MRFSLTNNCSHLCVTACQPAINGIFKNMSLLKTKLPWLLPKVECAPAHMACIVIDNASSMNSLALAPVTCCCGWPCRSVLNTFPTVWCMCSHIMLACGFLLVVGTSLILQPCRKNWNSGPMILPPLSWIHRTGHGYHESQTCAYFLGSPMFNHQFWSLDWILCWSLLEHWTHKVCLGLGSSKVQSSLL